MPGPAVDIRARLLRLQRDLFQANQRQINEAVESYTDEFRRYEATYRRSVKHGRGPVKGSELERAIRASSVVLIGDYHTFLPSQRSFLRIVRNERAMKVTIALEMLPRSADPVIERFFAGKLSESAFVRKVDFANRWPFAPFSEYAELFELARERGFRVIGMDAEDATRQKLAARDELFAGALVDALEEGSSKVYALVGEMHLAPSHLPRAVKRRMVKQKVDGLILRVHQNPDALWFELSEQGEMIDDDVHRVDDEAFALFFATPIVLQQSFLTWLEQTEDAPEDTPPGFDPAAGERLVRLSIDAIGNALDLPYLDALENLKIVGPRDLSFFEELGNDFNKRELRQLRGHILSGESCYVPKAQLIYLATLSLNHAAEESAHRFRHVMSGEGLADPRGLTDAFYARVMNEAVGFLGSRFVNPKRSAPSLEELEEIELRGSGLDAQAAKFALLHKRLERGEAVATLSTVFHAPPKLFLAVTHVLGYLLGDALYSALTRGKIGVDEVRSLFTTPLEPPGASLVLYFELASRLRKIARPPRRMRLSTIGRRQLSGA